MPNLDLAKSYLSRASVKLQEARRECEQWHCAESVSASQESLEFSVKALFFACGTPFKRTHHVDELEFAKVTPKIPSRAATSYCFPRVLLPARLWSGFYLVAKYGMEELGAGPDKLFRKEEAKLAAEHAQECYHACNCAYQELAHSP